MACVFSILWSTKNHINRRSSYIIILNWNMIHLMTLEEAREQLSASIVDFDKKSRNPRQILKKIVRKDVWMREVICTHLIIMLKDQTMLQEYLQYLVNQHGFQFCSYVLNYPITHASFANPMISLKEMVCEPIFTSIPSNSINSLSCCLHWNNDPNVFRTLVEYGADINLTNERGYFCNEENIPYYNHLTEYIHTVYCPKYVFGLVMHNEFKEIHNEVLMIAGEMISPNKGWTSPIRRYKA